MYILKRIRLELGSTVSDFARFVGLTPSAIYNYEANIRRPDYKSGHKIIEALKSKKYKLIYEQLREEK